MQYQKLLSVCSVKLLCKGSFASCSSVFVEDTLCCGLVNAFDGKANCSFSILCAGSAGKLCFFDVSLKVGYTSFVYRIHSQIVILYEMIRSVKGFWT